MTHPSRNFYSKRGVYLPLDEMGVGDSFFLPNGSLENDERAVRQMAWRRGMRLSLHETEEAEGPGLRVKRVA